METLPTWKKLLSDRGILGAAVEAGWIADGSGWRYPVGSGGLRWKAFDSAAKPKYLWKSGSVSACPYYMLPDLKDAIESAGGAVILASGEPDVLALRSAGAKNVLCCFGEGNIPGGIGADLKALGVSVVESYPDLDGTGQRVARKIADLLHEAHIGFRAFHLPSAEGTKYDINRLWIDCAFNADCFWEAIIMCPQIPFPVIPKQAALRPFDDLPAGFYEAIERSLGASEYKDDGWSKPIRCVLKSHEHDDKSPAASWHKDKHIFSCFKCGVTEMLAKDVGERLNLDWHTFLPPKPAPPPPRAKATGQPRIVFGWGETTDKVIERLTSDNPESPEALPIHWKNVRQFGGYADLLDAGKLMATIGDSGDGKTSLIETQLDSWRRMGHSGIMFGPEWTREQYVMRAIQRRGGPTLAAIRQHETWKKLNARSVTGERNYGTRLAPDCIEQAVALAKEVNAWPGKLFFVEKMGLPIEKAIEHMAHLMDQLSANGERITYAVFDYVQLMESAGKDDLERTKRVLAAIKTFCVDRSLIGVVGSQVTKSDGRAASHGAKNGQHSMQYARSDVFNLALAVSREVVNGNKSDKATVTISKNSLGRNGQTELYLNADRMVWHDVKQERTIDL